MKISSHPLPGHGTRTPWGVMLHTTGDGVPQAAYRDEMEPLEAARKIYGGMKEGPTFCISPDGSIERYRDPASVTWHCGVTATQRRDFLTGHWEEILGKTYSGVLSWWKARWPGVSSPQHLYPSESPNQDYIGIELIPCGTYTKQNGGSWKPVFGVPFGPKGRFTGAQYTAAAMLCLTLCGDYSIPIHSKGRVLGHEDVNPITRPGWDPGACFNYWDWTIFWGIVEGLEKHL